MARQTAGFFICANFQEAILGSFVQAHPSEPSDLRLSCSPRTPILPFSRSVPPRLRTAPSNHPLLIPLVRLLSQDFRDAI